MRLTKNQAVEKIKAGEELFIYTRTTGHTVARTVARIGFDSVYLKTARELERQRLIKHIGGGYYIWSGE